MAFGFGAGLRGGAYGGINGEGRALPINPMSGAGEEGAAISVEDSLEAAGKTMLAALGHSDEVIERRVQGGQRINAALQG